VFSGVTLGYSVIKITTLQCKSETRNKRLDGVETERQLSEDVPFDWKQLGQMLWEDILYLALAVLVYLICGLKCCLVFSSLIFRYIYI